MGERVVVLGAGYAGSVAVQRIQRELDDARLTWVSEYDYHLVRHEVHRAIRNPEVRERITVPVKEIKGPNTEFIQGRVVGLDAGNRRIELEDGRTVGYDYALVAIGSDTAFFGIPGLAERAHTVNSVDDAVGIHEAVRSAGMSASRTEPAQIVVGGAGLSGVQSAGEIAELRDAEALPVEIILVEALPEVMPGADTHVQRRIRRLLTEHHVTELTDHPVTEVEPGELHFDEGDSLPYDVLVWTGGVTGRRAFTSIDLENDHRRLNTDTTLRTNDERVFCVGDAAVVGLDGDPAPPTAQAAWDAGAVAADNIVRAIQDRPLAEWTYVDKGTLISVGEDALAHDVLHVPVRTFGGHPARVLKKLVAARWIATITTWRRALSAWNVL